MSTTDLLTGRLCTKDGCTEPAMLDVNGKDFCSMDHAIESEPTCERHPGTKFEVTANESKYRGAKICPDCHYESEFGTF